MLPAPKNTKTFKQNGQISKEFFSLTIYFKVTMPFSNTHNQMKMKFSPEQEFPDLSKHNNHMAKVLTPDMYKRLRDKQTSSGFTLDDVIQTGNRKVNFARCLASCRPQLLSCLVKVIDELDIDRVSGLRDVFVPQGKRIIQQS
ncbi:creatine kinase B-type isoform X1 [Arapaima gigas]